MSDRLADAVTAPDMAALVDDQHVVNNSGELVRWASQSVPWSNWKAGRDRAERIGATMARIGLDARNRERSQGEARHLGQTDSEIESM